MDFRDVIVWLGLIAIVVIIWDGLRRMKSTKVKPAEKQEPYIDPEEAARQEQIARELPNGGARVREMTETEQEDIKTRLNLRERVPMLMERVEVEAPADEEEDEIAENPAPAFQSELDFSSPIDSKSEEAEQQPEPEEAVGFSAIDDDFDKDETSVAESTELSEPLDTQLGDAEEEGFSSESYSESPAEAESLMRDEPEHNAESESVSQGVVESESEEPPATAEELGPVEDLVIIHVMAPKGAELSGSSVLDLLVTAGLRHGPMDIFHYRNPKGVTEFSLANCIHPGTFDPDAMNQVNTPGVTLFMQLPTGANAMEAFDHMVEMARFLAKHLEADVLDEDHSTVTGQRIEYYREKIRSFERSKLIPSS